MDLKLQRPLAACARTNRAFVSGETFYSALVRAEGRLQRIDCAADAWQGPPPQVLAWWRSVYPAAESTGSTLAPPDVLLDVLERLEERPEDASLRYLVALQLVRRRVLRIAEQPRPTDGARPAEELVLACRKRDAEYRVRVVPMPAADVAGVEERLAALLWSGEAA
ncbi:MAG: hypothetical protein EBZ59_02150 [Planctomycetia bacterium]|nr:hypothetical protein [Planctomycetia bacterium]